MATELVSCIAGSRTAPEGRKSITFDALILDDELGDIEAAWAQDSFDGNSDEDDDDDASQDSFVIQDNIFDTPVEDPDLLGWQFKIATDKRDPVFLRRVLELEREKVDVQQQKEYEISPMDKAKHFAYAMMSGEEKLCLVFDDYVDAAMADDWFSESHPHSRCECPHGHTGSLLVRLVRSCQPKMVDRCLKAGVDPNSLICDGDTRRMYWSTDAPQSKREAVKLEAVFEYGTALTAAAAIGDSRLLGKLIDAGANPEAHDFVVFAVAARHGHWECINYLLTSKMAEDNAKIHRACVVSLKNASIANQEKVIENLLQRIQAYDDWELENIDGFKSLKAKKSRPLSRWGSLKSVKRRHNSLLLKGERKHSFHSSSSSQSSRTSGLHTTVSSTNSELHEDVKISTRRKPSLKKENSFSNGRFQLVSEALTNALDELIKEGKEPGAVICDSLAQGIVTVVGYQRKLLPTVDFDARKLLAFYVSAASDENVMLSERVAKLLMDLGLTEYLLGESDENPLIPNGGQGSMIAFPDQRYAISTDHPVKGRKKSITAHVSSTVADKDHYRQSQSFRSSPGGAPGASSFSRSDALVRSRSASSMQLQKIKSMSSLTARTLRNMLKSIPINTMRMVSYKGSNSCEIAKVASEKERRSAVLSAAQVGHNGVLQQLLSTCSDDMVHSLAVQAATHRQKDTVVFLLDEIQSRKPRKSDHDFQQEVMASILVAAFASGDMEIVELVLERGADLAPAQIVEALSDVIRSNSKLACKSIPQIMEIASRNPDFGSKELAEALDVALTNSDITNLRAMKSILTSTNLQFVNRDHLVRYVHRSCGKSNEESWRIVADLLIKNLLKSEDKEAIQKDLQTLLLEAETLPQIHVGVLTLLMHTCDLEDPASDDDLSDDSDGSPSRWL